MASIKSLFVLHLSLFWHLRKTILHDCDISYVSSLLVVLQIVNKMFRKGTITEHSPEESKQTSTDSTHVTNQRKMKQPDLEVIKLFFSCSTQLSMKFDVLINLRLLTIANSLVLNIAEQENFSANKYENANYCWHFHIY